MIRYRLFEVQNDGDNFRILSLMHNRRPLPVGEWLEADVKRVRDGSGEAWYTSGWHVHHDPVVLVRYAQRFRRRRQLAVFAVEVDHYIGVKPNGMALYRQIMILEPLTAFWVPLDMIGIVNLAVSQCKKWMEDHRK